MRVPRVAAVVPVAGNAELLVGCLQALAAQRDPLDELVVVDDSADGTIRLDDPGITVLRSGGKGPYAARNIGWRHTDAEVILFLDVRSRPSREWAQTMSSPFEDPAVALVGGDVTVQPGRKLAARAAHAQQSFKTTHFVERPFFRPYLPTCNLAVRRVDLDRVGGFSEFRSGADADLCWRVLSDPTRNLVVVPGELMSWVPRERMTEFLEQHYRYGKSNHALRSAWASAGAPPRVPLPATRLAKYTVTTAARLVLAVALRREQRAAGLVNVAAGVANEIGYARAARQARRSPVTPASASA